MDWEEVGLSEFLTEYPSMKIVPDKSENLVIEGTLPFRAVVKDSLEIEDSYVIWMLFPWNFPKAAPQVKKLQRKFQG